MICPFKPTKNPAPKTTSIDKAFAPPVRSVPAEPVSWSPLTAGPYLVPVTRWIE